MEHDQRWEWKRWLPSTDSLSQLTWYLDSGRDITHVPPVFEADENKVGDGMREWRIALATLCELPRKSLLDCQRGWLDSAFEAKGDSQCKGRRPRAYRPAPRRRTTMDRTSQTVNRSCQRGNSVCFRLQSPLSRTEGLWRLQRLLAQVPVRYRTKSELARYHVTKSYQHSMYDTNGFQTQYGLNRLPGIQSRDDSRGSQISNNGS